MIKKINYWLILLLGLILVLLGVALRINNKTVFSALVIILGMVTEITSIVLLINRAIQRSR